MQMKARTCRGLRKRRTTWLVLQSTTAYVGSFFPPELGQSADAVAIAAKQSKAPTMSLNKGRLFHFLAR